MVCWYYMCGCEVGRSFSALMVFVFFYFYEYTVVSNPSQETIHFTNYSHVQVQDCMSRITTALEVSDARNQCCGAPKWCVGITCVVAKWAEVSQP